MKPEIILEDQGHGGPDNDDGKNFAGGCYMVPGFSEDDWTLAFSFVLRDQLLQAGFGVAMTRTADVLLSAKDRRDVEKRSGADLVLSLHVNTIDAPGSGLITFSWPGNKRMLHLASLLHDRCPEKLKRRKEWHFEVEKAPHWTSRARRVVSTFDADCLLIEVGFASSRSDLEYLMSTEGQQELAARIAMAVSDYRRELNHGSQNTGSGVDQQVPSATPPTSR